jgi:hypothetical protein
LAGLRFGADRRLGAARFTRRFTGLRFFGFAIAVVFFLLLGLAFAFALDFAFGFDLGLDLVFECPIEKLPYGFRLAAFFLAGFFLAGLRFFGCGFTKNRGIDSLTFRREH